MNSDPHESAAWRSFGMLDADEASAFDEAMRLDPELKQSYLEMERLTAVVAATAVQPVAPRAGQLQRLERQLGIHTARRTNWPAISGWAAAAVVTLFLLVNRESPQTGTIAIAKPHPPVAAPEDISPVKPVDGSPVAEETLPREMVEIPAFAVSGQPMLVQEADTKVIRQETRQLIQENEVLKEKVEELQSVERERFEAVPGTAWPIVMRMSPPGMQEEPTDISFDHEGPPMTAILGDALASAGDPYDEGLGVSKTGLGAEKPTPSAVPIYDPARDTGTLVVNNLPDIVEGESYNLWVTTQGKEQPVYVGKLPRSNSRAADSFDFNLGLMSTVPTGFILTRDPQGKPLQPTPGTTILQGP
ncbi:MAG: hypothetical protein EOP85_09975 [Verrucomicrobiaceae bacterium]|nr:MAG: hypothetical protein EOP85_09975 [Verrucomicrobiaceae bacterium]